MEHQHQDHPHQPDDYEDDLAAAQHNWDQPSEHLTFPVGNLGPGVDHQSPPAAEAQGSTSSLNPDAPEFQWQKYPTNEGIAIDLSGSQSSWGNSQRQGLDWTQYDEEMSGQPSMMYWGQSSPLAQGQDDEEQVISPIEDLENPFTLEEHAQQQLSYDAQHGQVFTEHQKQDTNHVAEQIDLSNEASDQQQVIENDRDDPQSVADESLSNIPFEAQEQNLSPTIENVPFHPSAAATNGQETGQSNDDSGPLDHTEEIFTASVDPCQITAEESQQASSLIPEGVDQHGAPIEETTMELAPETNFLAQTSSGNPDAIELSDTLAAEEDQLKEPEEADLMRYGLDASSQLEVQTRTEELVQETHDRLESELQDGGVLDFSAADEKIINEDQLLAPQNETVGQAEQLEEPGHDYDLATAESFGELQEERPNGFTILPEEPVKEDLQGSVASEDLPQKAALFAQDNRTLTDEAVPTCEAEAAVAGWAEEAILQTGSQELHMSPATLESVSKAEELNSTSFEPEFTDEVKEEAVAASHSEGPCSPCEADGVVTGLTENAILHAGSQELHMSPATLESVSKTEELDTSSLQPEFTDEDIEEAVADSRSQDLCRPVADGAPIHEDYETAVDSKFDNAASIEDDILVPGKEDDPVVATETSCVKEEAFSADSKLSQWTPESPITEVNGNTIETYEPVQSEVTSTIWESHRGGNVMDQTELDDTAALVDEAHALTTPSSLVCEASKSGVDDLISPFNKLNLEGTLIPAVTSDEREQVEPREIQQAEGHANVLEEALDSLEPVQQVSAPSMAEEQDQPSEDVSIPSTAEEQGPSSEGASISPPEDHLVEVQNDVSPEIVSDEARESQAPEKEVTEDSRPSENAAAALEVATAVAAGAAAAVAAAGVAKTAAKKPTGKKPPVAATSPSKPKSLLAAKEPPKKTEVKPARPTRLSPLRKAAPAAAPKGASKPAQPAAPPAAAATAAPKKPVSATTRPAAPLVKKTTAPAPTASAPKTSPTKTSPAKPAASTVAPKKPTTTSAASTFSRPATTCPAAPKPVANGDVKKAPTPTTPRVPARPATTSAFANATKKPTSTAAAKADPTKAATASKPAPSAAVKSTRPAPAKLPAARPAAATNSSPAKSKPAATAAPAAASVVKRNAALSPKSGAAK